jgi:hypothetical protein
MPITPFLNGERFDPETTRVLGVALEMTCVALRTGDCDDGVRQAIATKIIELAKAGNQLGHIHWGCLSQCPDPSVTMMPSNLHATSKDIHRALRMLSSLRSTFRISDVNSPLQTLERVSIGAEQLLKEANMVGGHHRSP